jgi:protein-S-isoprenylcysteine O-methyltransferase Ste14
VTPTDDSSADDASSEAAPAGTIASRAGWLLFTQRGWAPVPLLVGELLLGRPSVAGVAAGLALIAAGEGIRLWGVGHIGPRSRTRGEDTWGLIDTGPYGRVRNPLYLGNILLFTGVGALCGLAWAAAWVIALGVHYTLIVRWEESNLVKKLGAPYADYLRRVPRWLPIGPGAPGGGWDGPGAIKSERSTLGAVGFILALFAARALLPF